MPYQSQRRIEFHDTDLAGIAHFSVFFLLMESVEHEYLRSLGTSVMAESGGRRIGFPRLKASCDYFSPVRFEDVLDVQLEVLRKGNKSLAYGFTFRKGETLVARGKLTVVCCLAESGQPLQPISIPPEFADKIVADHEPSDAETERGPEALRE